MGHISPPIRVTPLLRKPPKKIMRPSIENFQSETLERWEKTLISQFQLLPPFDDR